MRKNHILYIAVIISILSLLCTIDDNVSALSYSSNVGIGFSFNPTLTISFSSSDLVISNLTPGTTSDSNNIVVSVSTNAAYGYTLSTNVGSNDITSPYYGSSDLIHSNNSNNGSNSSNSSNSSNHVFSSIAIDANYSDLSDFSTNADINTWGYSTSLDSGTTWSSYNGLSTSTNTTLVDSNDMTSSAIDFKIAAKASDNQTSGVYSNVINFMAVSKVAPTSLLDAFIASGAEQYNGYFKMQDMTSDICNAVDDALIPSELQLIDIRDDKVYWVAKLADKNCWMTQNLDLDIGGTGVAALTSENTDISTDPNITGTGIYSNDSTGGYSESGGVWTWAPVSNTITSNSIIDYSNNTVSNWNNNNYTPASAEGGNTYFYTSNNNNNDIRYNSLADCEKYHSDCLHYHVGNYYNWTAAVASNKSSTLAAATDRKAGNSICPKGWQLPNFSTTDSMQNDFVNLLYNSYNIKADNSVTVNSAYQTGGFNAVRTAPLWLTRSGQINEGSLTNSAVYGAYWTSIVWGSEAYELRFNTDYIWPKYYAYGYTWGRAYGFSVRCLTK